jgi:hypothetical protein
MITNYYDGYQYEYTYTDGTRNGDTERVYCEISGEHIDADDSRYVDRGRYSGDCVHYDHTIEINGDIWTIADVDRGDIVEVNGRWYRTNDDNIVEVDGEYYHVDDCTYLDDDGEWVLADDAVYSDRDEKHYRSDDCVESKNEGWILRSEAYEVDGDYYHESEVLKVVA